MKMIKKMGIRCLWVLLPVMACACNDRLDVKQMYGFDLETMPVQTWIKQDETVEIRCRLILEGEYKGTRFYIRYFQPDGKGTLKMDDGTVFVPNDRYPLDRSLFRLYYTSHSADQQTIDIYIEDSFGQVIKRSFRFQNTGMTKGGDGDRWNPFFVSWASADACCCCVCYTSSMTTSNT